MVLQKVYRLYQCLNIFGFVLIYISILQEKHLKLLFTRSFHHTGEILVFSVRSVFVLLQFFSSKDLKLLCQSFHAFKDTTK